MYIHETFLDSVLQDNKANKWPSKYHKKTAQALLLCNSRITTIDDLLKFGKMIFKMSTEEIKVLTFEKAYSLGFPLP